MKSGWQPITSGMQFSYRFKLKIQVSWQSTMAEINFLRNQSKDFKNYSIGNFSSKRIYNNIPSCFLQAKYLILLSGTIRKIYVNFFISLHYVEHCLYVIVRISKPMLSSYSLLFFPFIRNYFICNIYF